MTACILESAGFDDVRFEEVSEPVLYGHDLDAALAVVTAFQNTSAALASLSDGEAARTVERQLLRAKRALRTAPPTAPARACAACARPG